MSGLLEGRTDLSKYSNGCRQMENFIPLVQGPARRRQGSRYVASTKNNGKAWLRPFQASNIEQYTCEFGDRYIRFYTDHGQLLNSSGGIYELATPYLLADLTTDEGTCALQMIQSNDILYIVHPLYAPAKLERTGVGTFVFIANAVGVSKNGPFKDLNSDESIQISASSDTGNITLSASTGIFLDGMVGKYFYLQEGTKILVPQWEFNKVIAAAGVRRRSNSINYESLAGATYPVTTGNVKPTHLSGSRFDGDAGAQWDYTDDGTGVVLITSLVGAQPTSVVNATVIKRLPYSITATPGGSTHRWAPAAWTANDGFPESVCFFRERLVFSRGQTIWMSVAADFENFSALEGGQVLADSAIVMTIAADKKDQIEWMKAESQLLVGTASGEFAVGEYSNGAPLGPANVRAQRQSLFGSRAIVPITVGAAVLFLEKGGRRVREMSFDIRQSQYQSVDVTVLAEHVTKTTGISPSRQPNGYDGILDWTFATRPDHVLWSVRADGVLLGFTYNREQDVTGWHRHKLGYQTSGEGGLWGIVESVCAIASPDGTQEDLWLVVRRGDNRHVEWIGQPVQTEVLNTPWGGGQITGIRNELTLPWDRLNDGSLWELDAFYVDGGLSRTPSLRYADPHAPDTVATVTGLDHLENLVVQVLADGAPHPDCVVVGGAITLDRPAYTVHVGLNSPAILETMEIAAPTPDGTSAGKLKRASWVVARFLQSVGGYVGPDAQHLEQLRYRTPHTRMDTYVPFFTGDKRVDFPGSYEGQLRVYVLQDQPLPMTVVALIPTFAVRDRPGV
jgi:hypothetical protein